MPGVHSYGYETNGISSWRSTAPYSSARSAGGASAPSTSSVRTILPSSTSCGNSFVCESVPPVVQALARQRAVDLAVGVEDRAVRVPEGTRFDLRGAQDDDSV